MQDRCQQASLLYTPLLEAGYRLLRASLFSLLHLVWLTTFADYIGKADANCAWPGVLSSVCLRFLFICLHLDRSSAAHSSSSYPRSTKLSSWLRRTCLGPATTQP